MQFLYEIKSLFSTNKSDEFYWWFAVTVMALLISAISMVFLIAPVIFSIFYIAITFSFLVVFYVSQQPVKAVKL